MTSPAWLLIVPLLGVSFGYEPSADAPEGYDYTVQLEPELAEQMQRGRTGAIEANIPPEVAPIRRIIVTVGDDPLPKTLRPPTASPPAAATERTTYRQNVDTAQPGIDLLAQTGPAGGFGRNATGFNRRPRGTTTGPTTLPPADIRYQSLNQTMHQQLDAGFQAAGSQHPTAGDRLRETVNNVGNAGQQVIDNTRQTLSDAIAPPEDRSFDATRPPLRNLSDRVQEEFRNTGEAIRDSVDRATDNAWGRVGGSRYQDVGQAQQPLQNQQPSAPAGNYRDRYLADERSVLSGGQAEGNARTWDNRSGAGQQQPFDERTRREAQPPAAQQPTGTAANRSDPSQDGQVHERLRFPEQPRGETPSRTGGDEWDWSQDDARRQAGGQQPAAARTGGQTPPASGGDRRQEDNLWTTDRAPQSEGAGNQAGGENDRFEAPAIGGEFGAGSGQADVADWLQPQPESQPSAERATEPSDSSGSTPVWLLGWAIAVGSVVGNLFQWLNIVDLRNKYRVALRRSSPTFARSSAA